MNRHRKHPDENPVGSMERLGPRTLHTSADSPGQPNLAGAQIPGPGTAHLYYGEDGRLTSDAADPWEREGHLGTRGWLRRLFGRPRTQRK